MLANIPRSRTALERLRRSGKEPLVMLDDGCRVEGYTSEITRTFVLGKPTDKMVRVFEIVRRAQQAALATAKPNVPNEAVDAAARKVIVEAGYGPGFDYFTHRVGHGLGMEIHEWNYLVRSNMFGGTAHPRLQAGMVFGDEPGIYIKGEYYGRWRRTAHLSKPISGTAIRHYLQLINS